MSQDRYEYEVLRQQEEAEYAERIFRERLMRDYDYEPESGLFKRKHSRNGMRAGDTAGTVNNDGYVRIQIDSKRHYAHRLAWLVVNGKWPEHEVDHINGNRSDNRIANLRDVPHSVNQQNQQKPRGKSGVLGVDWVDACGRWRAQINVEGKTVHLGLFESPELAGAAYQQAKRELHALPF